MKDLVYFWCSCGVSLVGVGVVTGSLGLLCARLRRLEVTAPTGDVGLRMEMK